MNAVEPPAFSPLSSSQDSERALRHRGNTHNSESSSSDFHEVVSQPQFSKKDKKVAPLYDLDLPKISQRLLLWLTAMSSVTLVEGLIGLSVKNVHVLRNFFNIFALICTLAFSTRAIDAWNEGSEVLKEDSSVSYDPESGQPTRSRQIKHDRYYNFGFRRIALLATFFNCSFMICTSCFDWSENVHHLVEHWDTDGHAKEATITQES